MTEIGKLVIVIGALLVVAGVILLVIGRWHVPIGHLPGDIAYRRKNFAFYFPLGTSILISIILSLIFYFISRVRR